MPAGTGKIETDFDFRRSGPRSEALALNAFIRLKLNYPQLVIRMLADAGVDVDSDVGMLAEDFGRLVKDPRCVRPDVVLVEIQMHSAQNNRSCGAGGGGGAKY